MAIIDADELPWLIDVNVFMTPISHVNWSTNSVDTLCIRTGKKQTDNSAIGNEINFDLILAAGTWTFELLHQQALNRGIYTVQFGGSTVGTIDGYSGAGAQNVRSTITGIAVAATGKMRVKLITNSKNASSEAYWGTIQHIQLRRTA